MDWQALDINKPQYGQDEGPNQDVAETIDATPFNITPTSFQVVVPAGLPGGDPDGGHNNFGSQWLDAPSSDWLVYQPVYVSAFIENSGVIVQGSGGLCTEPYTYEPPPIVTSLKSASFVDNFTSPAIGVPSGGTNVEVGGSYLRDITSIKFGNQPGIITATGQLYAPAGTGTVPVTVTTPAGTCSAGNFTYVDGPTVTSISPAQGPANVLSGSSPSITITGQNFGTVDAQGNATATATYVLFGPVPYATIPKVNGVQYDMELAVPASAVTYTPPVYQINSKNVLHDAYWTITINPPQYPAAGPLDVRVLTTPFGDPTLEFEGDTVGNWSPVTSIEQPPSTDDIYTYVAAPTVTAVSPGGGPTGGGASVTLSGTHLSQISAIKFGNFSADLSTLVYNGDGSVTVASPSGSAGTVDVTVTTPGGTSQPPANFPPRRGFVDYDAFAFVTPPLFYSMTSVTNPVQSWGAWGPLSGGTQITINGQNLSSVTEVDFGGKAGTNLVCNQAGTVITVDSPVETTAGIVSVKLVSQGATGGSLDTGVQFYYEGVPSVTGLSIYTVDAAGGTQVIITGTGLYPASAVYFTNLQDPNVKSAAFTITDPNASPTRLVVTAPGGLVQAGYFQYVAVTTPAGTSPNSGPNSQVSYVRNQPTITGISPATGPAAGATVTLSGSNFAGTFAVYFTGNGLDEQAVSYAIEPNGTIQAASPVLPPGTYAVTLTNGVLSNAVNFTTTPSAYITGINPSSGLIDPGTLVTVTGVHIMPFDNIVNFGDIALTVQPGATDTSFQVISPSPLPSTYQGQTVDITLRTNYGVTPKVPADKFTYVAPGNMGIASLSQSSGPVGGGTTLTITGAYLFNVTEVDFGGVPGTIVSTSNIFSQVVVTSPPSVGFNPGTVHVTVKGEYGTTPISAADKFTYGATGPVISGVNPPSVLTNTQTMVTITGSGFTDPSVYFGFAGGATVLSYTYNQIVVTCPASSNERPVDVQVVTPAGTSPNVPADQFYYGAAPLISAVGRGLGPANFRGLDVSIGGTNLAGATEVDFGTTVITAFLVDNSTGIEFVLPTEGPETVEVTVKTPLGTSAAAPFTYTLAPFVDQVYPTLSDIVAGPTSGGTAMMITGINMNGATAVNFGNTVVPLTSANYTDLSNDFPGQTGEFGYISFTTPPGAPGTVNVTVTSPQGTSSGAAIQAATFTYDAPPTVSGISPADGGLAGGNSVTITGTGLSDVTEVDFGTVAVPISGSDSDNSISVAAPAVLATGTVDVTVVGLGGYASTTSPTDQYTYEPGPVVSGVSFSSGATPASGAIEGGTPVVITGTGLSGATVVFGGYSATILSETDSQITATSPPSYTGNAGIVDVTVTTVDGTSLTSTADQFNYTDAPFITSVTSGHEINNGTQAAGVTAGGDVVTIHGLDLDGATAVYFGGTPAASFSDDGYQITAVSPPGVVGTVDITVTNASGVSDLSTADQFTYGETPVVASLGSSSGGLFGTQVTIVGTGFDDATEVAFGSFSATFTVNPDESITATSPGNYNFVLGYQPGTVGVTVVTPYGTSAISPADQFTYEGTPDISSQDVTSGSTAGGTLVTITGTSLSGATVDFGANPATVLASLSTDSKIVVLSPEATNSDVVDVTVTTAYGTATETDGFIYYDPPTLTSLSQSTGTTAGGTLTIISGENISGASEVYFGGVPAIRFYSFPDGTLWAVSPAGDPSTVDVTVVTGGGTSLSSPADQFTYLAPPDVTGISPAAGPEAGGTVVTIIGTGLTSATEVDFGFVPATSFTINSDGSITADSPAVNNPATVEITVETPVGRSSGADQFTYAVPAGVSGLSVSSGSRDGGNYVSIYGSDLGAATAVDFGASAATILDASYFQIDVLSPAGAVGATVDVTVVSPGGTSSIGTQDQFSYFQAAPVVTGVNSPTGAAAGGETVTITGTDLDGATEVDFGGVAGTIVAASDTPTQIQAIVPPGTEGTVDVTVTTSIGMSSTSSSDEFTGVAPPAVNGLNTLAGLTSGGTYVTIAGTDFTGATAIDFGSTAGSIVFNGGSYILAKSPAHSAGNIDITVVTPFGTSTTSSADQFTFVAPPVTSAANYSVTTNSTLNVSAAEGVLANDTDPQALPMTAFQLTSPANGYLAFNGDGSFSYTPFSGFVGTDSFTYQATNGVAASAPVTVTFTVGQPTLSWTPGQSGNWTDPQWSAGASYPDNTVNASVGGIASVVNVTSNQSAYGLSILSNGQVAVGAGAVLAVTTDASVTDGASLNIDPAGLFSTGGTFTLDTGGSVSGGPVIASAYQLNDGTVSANLGGGGGVTVGSGGTVTLSGTNTFAGATEVTSGALIISSAASLPDGSDLTVGSAAAFASPIVVTPASPVSPASVAAAAVASSAPTIPASPPRLSGLLMRSDTALPNAIAARDAVLKGRISAESIHAAGASRFWAAMQSQNDSQTASDLRRIAIDQLLARRML